MIIHDKCTHQNGLIKTLHYQYPKKAGIYCDHTGSTWSYYLSKASYEQNTKRQTAAISKDHSHLTEILGLENLRIRKIHVICFPDGFWFVKNIFPWISYKWIFCHWNKTASESLCSRKPITWIWRTCILRTRSLLKWGSDWPVVILARFDWQCESKTHYPSRNKHRPWKSNAWKMSRVLLGAPPTALKINGWKKTPTLWGFFVLGNMHHPTP